MGKETKEMLKTINANLEQIMKHLKIEKQNTAEVKKNTEVKKENKAAAKKPVTSNLPTKKSGGRKK